MVTKLKTERKIHKEKEEEVKRGRQKFKRRSRTQAREGRESNILEETERVIEEIK